VPKTDSPTPPPAPSPSSPSPTSTTTPGIAVTKTSQPYARHATYATTPPKKARAEGMERTIEDLNKELLPSESLTTPARGRGRSPPALSSSTSSLLLFLFSPSSPVRGPKGGLGGLYPQGFFFCFPKTNPYTIRTYDSPTRW
jgi:hypothetical protein